MIRTIFMGTPEFAVPSLAALLAADYDLVGVYTRPDQPAGRGQKLAESPVKQLARSRGLPIYQPETLRVAAAQADLAALAADLIVVAAYGLILPQAVLTLPRYGCVNVHGSLLPRHRGAAPIAAAILDGDAETGVSIMLMDAGVDTGPALSTAAIPIAPDDTTGTLTEKLAVLGAELLVATLPGWLRGETFPQPQPTSGASFAPRIKKEDGRIAWAEPAERIARRVRAYQPWPGAYTHWNGQLLRILRAEAASQASGDREQGTDGKRQEPALPAGTVVAGPGGQAGVVTGAGVLWLNEIQLAGKRTLPVSTFLQGARGFVGSKLE